MNLSTHLARAGLTYPDRPAVALGKQTVLNYAQLADRVSRLAHSLVNKFQLNPGDRVALVLKNCPQYVELLYACWHAGLVAVPVNAKLHRRELGFVLEDSGSRVCFISMDLKDVNQAFDGSAVEQVVETPSVEYERLVSGKSLQSFPRQSGDAAWLFYTSGTTGRSKGAVLSHKNLQAMCLCYFADVDQGAPWRSILHAAPMSHGSGLYGLAHVMQASCHVIPESEGFHQDEIFSLLDYWPSVSMFAAPTMVKRLVEHRSNSDAANLKTLIYGGGPMYVEDCQAALGRFGPRLAQLYGQGESPMTITSLNSQFHADDQHPDWLERLASVGVPQSAVDVRVMDQNDRFLSPDEVGEVVVQGDTVMSGYWNNETATADTVRNGWLHTGDLGYFNEKGFLTLTDRSKDLIISGGANIYPREIEEVLISHPHMLEASVIGRQDKEWGEVPVAYIVTKGNKIDYAQLDDLCLSNIARFKRPKDYIFVPKLPKNNYGKILKTELRVLDGRRD